MLRLVLRVIGSDGCYRVQGLRVRAARGNGEGSLDDEMARGVVTPLHGDEGRRTCLGLCSGPDLRGFIRSLPVARPEPLPVPDAVPDDPPES